MQRFKKKKTTTTTTMLFLHHQQEQVFQNMMDKLRRANAMLGENTQQPRVRCHPALITRFSLPPNTHPSLQYIVREYNKEKHLFDHFSSSYEDFKAGTIPLLESLEKGFAPLFVAKHILVSHIVPQNVLKGAQRSLKRSRNLIVSVSGLRGLSQK